MRGNCFKIIILTMTLILSSASFAEEETLFTQDGHEPLFTKKQKALSQQYGQIQGNMPAIQKMNTSGCRFSSDLIREGKDKVIALTFDDGPSLEYNTEILRILAKQQVKATFFNIGRFAQPQPYLVQAMEQQGHLIGNHSWSHPNFQTLTIDAQNEQIKKGDQAQAQWMNTTPKFFRYPYGASTCEGNKILHNNNYVIAGWTIDSCDWGYEMSNGELPTKLMLSCGVNPKNKNDMETHVLEEVRKQNGGIILFHSTHLITVEHLNNIISTLKAEGYTFVRLDHPSMR